MRKTADTFIPSVVLDSIYEILNESICIAGNEDVYYDDIIWPVVRLLNAHPAVSQFLWEDCRDGNDEGGILFISWMENNQLRHEHFKYQDYDEDMRYERGERKNESLVEKVILKVWKEYNT